MCGITGIYDNGSGGAIDLDILKDMIHVMRYRGPDESGVYLDDQVALGHARLSIIDLTGGTQPIHNSDKTLWIVFNGEVFNYLELKHELAARGQRFYTNTDTEVILHMYEEYGPECLSRFNGQFAIAIWDTRKKELFLARDRMGIRPLHYAYAGGAFVFGSEVKSLFAHPQVERKLRPQALDEIFTFWTTLPGRTFFEGVEELKPGHYLLLRDSQIRIEPFWRQPLVERSEQRKASVDELKEEVTDLLTDSVRLRLRADVTVGCYLSGGLDSSGITSMVRRNFNQDVRTFGVCFEQAEFNEARYQQEMVDYLKVSHEEITATDKGISEAFPEVLWHCEKPILRTAPVPLYLLSGLVQEKGIKVVLTGEGADEIFGGYNIFKEALVRQFWAREPKSACRPKLLGKLYPYIFNDPRLEKTLSHFFRQGIEDVDNPFYSHLIRWNNTRKIRRYLSREMTSQIGEYDPVGEMLGELPEDFKRMDVMSRAQYLEAKLFLSQYLLSSQGDRVAAAHSLEIRLPYLDYRIIEFMSHIPSYHKIYGLDEKYLLKEVFRGYLPDTIVRRPKHPYRAPIKQSLFGSGSWEYVREMLGEHRLRATGLFDPAKVALLHKKVAQGTAISEVDGMAIAGILSAQIVADRFLSDFRIDGQARQPLTICVDHRGD